MAAKTARPTYDIGDVVSYRDHHERVQVGRVKSVEAHWRFASQREPTLVYTISHPTYARRRTYVGADGIFGLANSEAA